MPKRSLNDLTVKQLEKRLDYYFSLFIRLRDSNDEGIIFCCTCGRPKPWRDRKGVGAECGHYSKRNKSHRFTEMNCSAQCNYCNDRMKGEADKHAEYIDKKYGEGTARGLRESENILIKRPRQWYLDKIEYYKNKAKKLAKEKGQEL